MCLKDKEVTIKDLEDYKVDSDEPSDSSKESESEISSESDIAQELVPSE